MVVILINISKIRNKKTDSESDRSNNERITFLWNERMDIDRTGNPSVNWGKPKAYFSFMSEKVLYLLAGTPYFSKWWEHTPNSRKKCPDYDNDDKTTCRVSLNYYSLEMNAELEEA